MKGREGEKKERAVAKAPRGRCRSIKLLLRANMPPTITVLKHSRHHLIVVTYQFEMTDECHSAKDLQKGLEEEGPFHVIAAFVLTKQSHLNSMRQKVVYPKLRGENGFHQLKWLPRCIMEVDWLCSTDTNFDRCRRPKAAMTWKGPSSSKPLG